MYLHVWVNSLTKAQRNRLILFGHLHEMNIFHGAIRMKSIYREWRIVIVIIVVIVFVCELKKLG